MMKGAIFWGIVFTAWGIGGLIYIRLLGNYKDSKFGKLDTRLYSSLCLFLGISFF